MNKEKIIECYKNNFPNSFHIVCMTSKALKPKGEALGQATIGKLKARTIHYCGYASECRRLNK